MTFWKAEALRSPKASIMRVEQFCPSCDKFRGFFEAVFKVKRLVWCQEEPKM